MATEREIRWDDHGQLPSAAWLAAAEGDIAWLTNADGERIAAIVPAQLARATQMLVSALPAFKAIGAAAAAGLKPLLAELEKLAYPVIHVTYLEEDDHGKRS